MVCEVDGCESTATAITRDYGPWWLACAVHADFSRKLGDPVGLLSENGMRLFVVWREFMATGRMPQQGAVFHAAELGLDAGHSALRELCDIGVVRVEGDLG